MSIISFMQGRRRAPVQAPASRPDIRPLPGKPAPPRLAARKPDVDALE
jgi:hypothetical protein